MNPNNVGILEDIKFPKILAVCHRGTQTNKQDTPDSSTHSSKSIGISPGKNSSNEGSVTQKFFEIDQILQNSENPESITIVKDTFSEEIHDHSTCSETRESNRYKYCREVIKPFLKDYPSDCQPSDEELIKDALESVQKDFPDYQPCFGNNDGACCEDKLGGSKQSDNKDKDPFLCCEKVNAQPPCISNIGTAFIPLASCDIGKKGKEKDKSGSTSSSASKDGSIDVCKMNKKDKKQKADDFDYPNDPCAKPKCPKKETDSKSSEEKIPKKEHSPASICTQFGPKCTTKMKTGCETEEDSKELAKKGCKDNATGCKPTPVLPPGPKSVMEAHCEAINTMKSAASAIMSKVCEVTKDTVTLIRTESAKQMEKLKTAQSECESMCNSQTSRKSKDKDSCVTEVTNILGKKNILENLKLIKNTVDPEDKLHDMVEKMDSTISMISDKVDINSLSSILKTESKKSCDRPPSLTVNKMTREDQPVIVETQDIANAANNVFTAIKSKIFSIFSDAGKNADITENTDDDED